MSASTDRRVARLVGRIAEERAARGRPAISHAPRIARTFSVEIVEPPEVQGGEANVLKAIHYEHRERGRDVILVTLAVQPVDVGPYLAEVPQRTIDVREAQIATRMTDPAMIDYAGITNSPTIRKPISETSKPDEEKISIVDRLVPGW